MISGGHPGSRDAQNLLGRSGSDRFDDSRMTGEPEIIAPGKIEKPTSAKFYMVPLDLSKLRGLRHGPQSLGPPVRKSGPKLRRFGIAQLNKLARLPRMLLVVQNFDAGQEFNFVSEEFHCERARQECRIHEEAAAEG